MENKEKDENLKRKINKHFADYSFNENGDLGYLSIVMNSCETTIQVNVMAIVHGRVVGMVRITKTRKNNYVWITDLVVDEWYRGGGYGRILLQSTNDIAKIIGVTFCELCTKEDSWTNDWYKRYGYEYEYNDDGFNYLIKKIS